MKNLLLCFNCNTVLESSSCHDYKECMCENHTFVDGGAEYKRYGGKNIELIGFLNPEEFTFSNAAGTLTRTFDESMGLLSTSFTWGSRGKTGKDSLSYSPLSTLESDHINNIMRTQTGLPLEYLAVFNWLLKSRNHLN